MDISCVVLPNGIRVIHLPVQGAISHCGVFINAGTRDESEAEQGIAHFIEHVIFKGTEKRTLYQVLNRLENVGADLNAFTTKEETCIYASFLNEYYDRTLELFSDILFHSTFPEKELKKEKLVVIDEIKSYQDNPSDQIFDDFEDMVFAGHPLGKNILGTPKTVKSFTSDAIRSFMQKNYTADEVVICSVGNISVKRFQYLSGKYFGATALAQRVGQRILFSGYRPTQIVKKRKIFQSHCILGAPGYSYKDERRYALAFLNNILGGPMMNSRLSIALRERNGLTYNIESHYTTYSDTGLFTIYFGTDKKLLEKAFRILDGELKKLREKKLGKVQLHTAKKQLMGQLAIGQESKGSQMLSMGKSFLVQNHYISIEDILRKVEELTAEQLLEAANEVFDPKQMSQLLFTSK